MEMHVEGTECSPARQNELERVCSHFTPCLPHLPCTSRFYAHDVSTPGSHYEM